MTQGELAFKYEVDHQGVGLTGMGGIGTYFDLACRSGMVRSIERHVKARKSDQGWTDAERIRIDCVSVANHDLIQRLDEPGIWSRVRRTCLSRPCSKIK